MKNLIIGTICNYGFCKVEPFFVSMRKYMSPDQVDCIMLVSNISEFCRRQIESFGVKLIDLDYRSTDEIDSYRWRSFCNIIQETDYEYILSTDVRDVFFQGDIFDGYLEKKITIALEEPLLGEQYANAKWFSTFIGEEEYRKYEKQPVICCGTILGTKKAMIDILERMDSIITNECRILEFGVAQSALQYLVYSDGINKYSISDVHTGIIFTAEHAKYIGVSNQIVKTDEGVIPKVIHQYDRIERLNDIVEKKYRNKDIEKKRCQDLNHFGFEECIYYGDFSNAMLFFSEKDDIKLSAFGWSDIIMLYIVTLRHPDSVDRRKVIDTLYHLLLVTRIRLCNIYYLRLIKEMHDNRDNPECDGDEFKGLFERVALFYLNDNQIEKYELFMELTNLY